LSSHNFEKDSCTLYYHSTIQKRSIIKIGSLLKQPVLIFQPFVVVFGSHFKRWLTVNARLCQSFSGF